MMAHREPRRPTGTLPTADLLRRNPQRRHPLGWCINDCDEIKMGWCALYLAVKEGLRPEQTWARLAKERDPLPTQGDCSDMRKMHRDGTPIAELPGIYCMDAQLLYRIYARSQKTIGNAKRRGAAIAMPPEEKARRANECAKRYFAANKERCLEYQRKRRAEKKRQQEESK